MSPPCFGEVCHLRRAKLSNECPFGIGFAFQTLMELRLVSLSVFFGVTAFSLFVPFAALYLASLGYSSGEIGIFTCLSWAGLFIVSPFVSKFIKRWGFKKVNRISAFLALMTLVGFLLVKSFYGWCVIHFLSGCIGAFRWVLTESLVTQQAPSQEKGKFIGIYETVLGASFMTGPFLLTLLSPSTLTPLVVATALNLLSFVFAFLIQGRTFEATSIKRTETLKWKDFVRRCFPFVGLSLLGGLYESGLNGQLPLFTRHLHFSASQSSSFVGLIALGSFLAQYPTGRLADQIKSSVLLTSFLLILQVLCLGLIFVKISFGVLVMATLSWGALGGSLYTLSLCKVAQFFQPGALISGTSYLVSAYTMGGFVGPMLGGWAQELSPRFGLLTLFSALNFAVLSSVWLFHRKPTFTGSAPVNRKHWEAQLLYKNQLPTDDNSPRSLSS